MQVKDLYRVIVKGKLPWVTGCSRPLDEPNEWCLEVSRKKPIFLSSKLQKLALEIVKKTEGKYRFEWFWENFTRSETQAIKKYFEKLGKQVEIIKIDSNTSMAWLSDLGPWNSISSKTLHTDFSISYFRRQDEKIAKVAECEFEPRIPKANLPEFGFPQFSKYAGEHKRGENP